MSDAVRCEFCGEVADRPGGHAGMVPPGWLIVTVERDEPVLRKREKRSEVCGWSCASDLLRQRADDGAPQRATIHP